MTTWLKAKGKLIYSPARPGLKKQRAANDFFVILETPGDVAKYYSHWVKKSLYLDLQLPAWRPHVTVLDGRKAIAEDKLPLWKKYAGEIIKYEYSVDIEQHWKFWVLPVRSPRLAEIRSELGLPQNNHGFHLTIGRMH